MKKVLLTGANGFIGRHAIQPLIDKHFEVHAISTQKSTIKNKNWQWHQLNLLDTESIGSFLKTIKPTHLLHLAWYTEHGKYWQSPLNFKWVQSSLELLQQFHYYGGRRIVMAGSCIEYDWNYGYCHETLTPLSNQHVYGTCKHTLQKLLESYANLHQLSWAWGRIFSFYGPHEPINRIVPHVITSLLKNQETHCTQGTQIRDFLYVQDVANAFVELLESEIQGVINIGSGQPIMLKDIVSEIGSQLALPHLIKLGSKPTPPHESPMIIARNERLLHELNWLPSFSLETGLENTILWWKKHLEL